MANPLPMELIGVSLAMLVAAALLGYFLQKGCGVVLLSTAAALASVLCLAATALGGWIGLMIAVLLVGLLAAAVGQKLGGPRGARLVSMMWSGFCLCCAIGYWVGGSIGLLTITLPANVLFWITLYLFSGFLLPLKDNSLRGQAFRSLVTFSLGTNFPYHVMKDRKLEKRVDGNPYKAFFGGPGIVITGCDHVVAVTNGLNIKPPEEPGVIFTGRYETVQSVIDLRPQLRAFYVEARTLDGIPLRVLVFVPFRIRWGGKKPELGRPFPFQQQAIFQALTGELVEQKQDQKHKWDELVEIHATRIMRDVVSRYKFDDLCLALGPCLAGADDIRQRYAADEQPSPYDRQRDPRYRIRDEVVARLTREMDPLGIEVIGGGISNLMPADSELLKQRTENWRTKWQNRINLVQAERDAQRTRLLEQARVGVEQDLLVTVSKMLSNSLAQGEDMSDALLAAALVTSLERMAEEHHIRERLPEDTRQQLIYLGAQGKRLLQSSSSAKSRGG